MWAGKRLFASMTLGGLFAAPAEAQQIGARGLARGGAGRADPEDVRGIAWNLAAVATSERYDVYVGTALGSERFFSLEAGAVDSRTSVVTFGGGYHRTTDEAAPTGDDLPGWKEYGSDLSDPTLAQGVHLGLALPVLERRLSFALLGRYDWQTSALGGDDLALNVGLGVAVRPAEWMSIAVGARELVANDYPGWQRSADLGVRWMPGDFVGFEADVVAPLDADFSVGRMSFQAGADVGVVEWLVLRTGAAFDGGVTAAAAGVGLVSEKASLDYGLRIPVASPESTLHALDVRIAF